MAYTALTQTTRDMFDGRKPPRVNMTNGKPYRTASQKAKARDASTKCDDGTYRANVLRSFHPVIPVR